MLKVNAVANRPHFFSLNFFFVNLEYHCLIFGFSSTTKWMVVLFKCPAELHGKTELRPPSSSWSAWAFVSLKSIWFWMLLCLPKRWRTFQGNEQMILWTLINHINIRNGWMKMEKKDQKPKKKKYSQSNWLSWLTSFTAPQALPPEFGCVGWRVHEYLFGYIILYFLLHFTICQSVFIAVELKWNSLCINGRKEAIS